MAPSASPQMQSTPVAPSTSSNLATATYTRLVNIYTPCASRSRAHTSTQSRPPSPPPQYTDIGRARSRTISDTDVRRSKRRHLVPANPRPPLSEPSSSGSSNPLLASRTHCRAKRHSAQSTSHRAVNIAVANSCIDSSYNCQVESPSSDTETDAMSFLNPATNYLSARVEIVFENEGVVEMVGGPNTG
jgi:hypothetical protein